MAPTWRAFSCLSSPGPLRFGHRKGDIPGVRERPGPTLAGSRPSSRRLSDTTVSTRLLCSLYGDRKPKKNPDGTTPKVRISPA